MQLLQELVSIGDASGRPTLQVAMTLLKAVYPAKVMHLQRCYSQEQLAEMQEELQQTSQRLMATWLQEERLTAAQWQVASLPPHMGGLGLPNWQQQGPIIRTSALYTMSREHAAVASELSSQCEMEQPTLWHQLQGLVGRTNVPNVDLDRKPCDITGKTLAKKLRRVLHLTTLSAIRTERSQHEALAQAVDIHAHGHDEADLLHNAMAGAWLHAMPTSTALTVSNEAMRYGCRRRLALQLHEPGTTCRACETAGAAPQALDQCNRHGATCRHVGGIFRHNGVRDIIAEYSKRTHMQVTMEQRWPSTRRADSQGSRALKTADVHIQHGVCSELWLDIRITTANEQGVQAAMGQAERAKCKEYGQEHVPRPGAFGAHLIPMIFAREGAVTKCTAAVLKWQWLARARLLLSKGWCWSQAVSHARSCLLTSLSTWLVKQDYHLWQRTTGGGAPPL